MRVKVLWGVNFRGLQPITYTGWEAQRATDTNDGEYICETYEVVMSEYVGRRSGLRSIAARRHACDEFSRRHPAVELRAMRLAWKEKETNHIVDITPPPGPRVALP
jgi:hypothetical protein